MVFGCRSENEQNCFGNIQKSNELIMRVKCVEILGYFCLQLHVQVIEKADAVELGCVSGEVEICGLSFSYGDMSPPVLDGVDLHIKAGETIALVGPSGGGKTTLVKLLLRLYQPLSGDPCCLVVYLILLCV